MTSTPHRLPQACARVFDTIRFPNRPARTLGAYCPETSAFGEKQLYLRHLTWMIVQLHAESRRREEEDKRITLKIEAEKTIGQKRRR